MRKLFKKLEFGFSLVEVMLAVAIFSVFAIALFSLSLDTIKRDSNNELSIQGLAYAQEGIEATRNIRDRGYLLLTNGDHGLDLTLGVWSFVLAPENIDDFYDRTITISDVFRDEYGNIINEGGILDPDTKLVSSEVEWQEGMLPRSIVLESYLSNWRGDDWIQTTCAELDLGTFEDTEILEEAGPPEDNCSIKIAEIEVSSDFLETVNIGKHAMDVDVEGNYAYLGLESSSEGVAVVDISDKNNPFITDTLDVGDKGRYVRVDGNELYVGVKDDDEALTVVNITNPSNISIISTTELEDYGNQPAIDGDILFMAVDDDENSIVSFNINNPSSPQELDSIDLSDDAYVISLDGDYAYVGTDDDHRGFVVLDVSDPSNLEQVAYLNVGEEVNAIYIYGAIAYIGTEEDDESLHIIDISDPENPVDLGYLDIGGEIQDLTVVDDYLYAAVDRSHHGMAAIDISTPLVPTLSYSLDISGKGSGIDSDGSYVYVTTHSSNKGLVIVGTTEESMAISGNYSSIVFDTASSDTQYNFIEWDETEAPGGDVKIQLRTASSSAGIAGANWVGPDGTSETYYTDSRTEIALDPGRNGVRYLQFKAIIESDGVTSPLLSSIRINYTP